MRLLSAVVVGMDSCIAVPLVIKSKGGQVEIHTKRRKRRSGGLYHNLPKELQATFMMTCMEDAHKTRKSNNAACIRSREWREQKETLTREKGMDDAEDKFIQSLIYHKMGHSDVYWATAWGSDGGAEKNQTQRSKY